MNVYLASDKSADVEDKWLLDDFKADVVPLDDVIENVDLLIELSASVSAKHVASVRNRGGRFVAYRVGNDFVLTTELYYLGRIILLGVQILIIYLLMQSG